MVDTSRRWSSVRAVSRPRTRRTPGPGRAVAPTPGGGRRSGRLLQQLRPSSRAGSRAGDQAGGRPAPARRRSRGGCCSSGSTRGGTSTERTTTLVDRTTAGDPFSRSSVACSSAWEAVATLHSTSREPVVTFASSDLRDRRQVARRPPRARPARSPASRTPAPGSRRPPRRPRAPAGDHPGLLQPARACSARSPRATRTTRDSSRSPTRGWSRAAPQQGEVERRRCVVPHAVAMSPAR